MPAFPSILIENVHNYGFKAVTPQIVSCLVERGDRVTQEFGLNSNFGFFIINFSRNAVPVSGLRGRLWGRNAPKTYPGNYVAN
jgi:hypothetical protein